MYKTMGILEGKEDVMVFKLRCCFSCIDSTKNCWRSGAALHRVVFHQCNPGASAAVTSNNNGNACL